MIHLEVIQIRTAKINQSLLNEFLANWFAQVNKNGNAGKIKIYKHINVETDFSIHIEYNAKRLNDDYQLGERLIAELKEFGIVNRSIWVEQQFKMTNTSKE